MIADTVITDEFIISKKFNTSNEFSLFIEQRVVKFSLSYMDAIIAYCDEADIDVGSIKTLVNKSLKEKIKLEAEEKNYFRKRNLGTLPL
jgi:hypothetical protein